MMMEKYGLISKFYSSVAEDVSENDELIVKHLDIEKKRNGRTKSYCNQA